jgi:hypothetical protein
MPREEGRFLTTLFDELFVIHGHLEGWGLTNEPN